MDDNTRQGPRKWQLGLGVVIVLVLIGLAIYSLAINPMRAQVVRDLFIIFIAVEVLAVGVLLGILTWQIYQLVRMLQEEILPILKSTQEAASTVKGTASFVGEHVVSPIARASGYVAGLREAIAVLAGRSRDGGA
jgi:4-amino-4-deoxy-L-arabinose transferase-like glycosyltransferase